MNNAEGLAKKNAIASYFDVQRQYYEFLKEKLGDKFRGDSDKANGQLRIGNEWRHLASDEDRLKLRTIALECIAGNTVFAVGRMGRRNIAGMINFPYLVESPGSEDDFSWSLWNFNEIVSVWIYGNPLTDDEIQAHITRLSEQNMMEAALKTMPCTVEFDSEW